VTCYGLHLKKQDNLVDTIAHFICMLFIYISPCSGGGEKNIACMCHLHVYFMAFLLWFVLFGVEVFECIGSEFVFDIIVFLHQKLSAFYYIAVFFIASSYPDFESFCIYISSFLLQR